MPEALRDASVDPSSLLLLRSGPAWTDLLLTFLLGGDKGLAVSIFPQLPSRLWKADRAVPFPRDSWIGLGLLWLSILPSASLRKPLLPLC